MPIIKEAGREDHLYKTRHSLSHVMAQAVQKLFPGTLLGFGPPIADGFYYDFLFPESSDFTEAILPEIEEFMKKIIKENQEFRREDLPSEEALARLRGMEEPHKLEYAQELITKKNLESIRFYSNGPFVDMCEGPHVKSTAELPQSGFRLHGVAGAYWRGDEKNVMLTRIYAYAYPTKQELESRVRAVEEAKKRDHRLLGQQLEIFVISEDVGKGLPLWMPNGAAIRHELEKLAYEMEFRAGYKLVASPHITKAGLYRTSGHIPLYEHVMYPPMRIHEDAAAGGSAAEAGEGEPEQYYLKPMNCPHHHMIYAAEKRSYRDLPLRLTEYGSVYRFERTGQLQGLTRVRGMTMNDAHIYVTPDQLKEEFKAVMELHRAYYDLFQFQNFYLRLSLWDPDDNKRRSKYFDDPESWAYTETIVQEALEELGEHYRVAKGEAAFYGPKVDFQFDSVLEKEFTLSTNQLDFAVPPRFDLRFTDRDGSEKHPYCIHRAPLGTHERFIAFLIEHYGGAFPTWLAPVQVLLIPISEKYVTYASGVKELLFNRLIRVEVDQSDATTGKKIRAGLMRKIPILLIVGAREEAAGEVTVRRYGIESQREMTVETFLEVLDDEVSKRTHVQTW